MDRNPRRVTVTDTGAATAPGGYANSGVHIGDVNLLTGVPVTTRYLQQVQRIAPPVLLDRDAELVELAEFCTSPTTAGTYVWWRAKAWSGKSALMSWFVLHPPECVRLVSFFITARLASQNDRAAFIDNLLEQLLALLGQHLPPFLTESTREAHLLGLLAEAAEVCQQRGEQFVLLVDGLDEDRSVHDGPDAHSIAALLPAEPPAGMRVIVAGRPNPPIPSDVPSHHPLRDEKITRVLAPSPRAQAIREEMERELKRLLRGTVAEQDLLGLVAAAGGGLSATDLAELTGWSQWQVDDHLRTVTGRSFAVRDSHFQSGGPAVYLLGHEELQVTAQDMLGPARVDGYRQRLHTWANQYKGRGWPASTPEYLMRGYFRMLAAIGDIERMVACATDPARQDQMLNVSGGDAAALAEITTAQQAILDQDHPDLIAMFRLAVHRDHLADRNNQIPTQLPAVWAMVGQVNRAESIADSIDDLADRGEALASVAIALVEAGHLSRAARVLDRAEEAAQSSGGVERQGLALAAVAQAAVKVGQLDRAEEIATSIDDAYVQARALAVVAEAAVWAGKADRAEEIALSLIDATDQTRVLAVIVEAAARAGRVDHAAHLLGLLEETAESITDPDEQAWTVRIVADATAWTGQFDRAEDITAFIIDPYDLVHVLGTIVVAAAQTGQVDRVTRLLARAEETARTIPDPRIHARALAAVAKVAAGVDQIDRAQEIAMSIASTSEQAWASQLITEAVATTGQLDHAEDIARSVPEPRMQAPALVAVAEAAARVGHVDRASSLLTQAEEIARSNFDSARQMYALATVVEEVAKADQVDQAEEIAAFITEPDDVVCALAVVAEAAARTGQMDRATRLFACGEESHAPSPNPTTRSGYWSPSPRPLSGPIRSTAPRVC